MEAAAKASGRELGHAPLREHHRRPLQRDGLFHRRRRAGRAARPARPLFGRNFDWLPTKGITEHTLVVVYKGEGKRAFAAVTVSPISGVISGMNDAGLALTINEISIRKSRDKAQFNWKGTPLLSGVPPRAGGVLHRCGGGEAPPRHAANHDLLPDALRQERRRGVRDHADQPGGAQPRERRVLLHESLPHRQALRRGQVLAVCEAAPLQAKDAPKLGVADVFTKLDEVSQGSSTLQSMVFEPADRVLHLAYGEGHATKLKPHRIALGELFAEK